MSAELLIANLLRVASEDLDAAKLLAEAGNRNAVYLCEQAAEKVIRAVVTSEGQHAGIKHDLAEIVDMVPDDNPLKADLRAVEHLARYATAFRYPVSSSRTKRILPAPSDPELSKAIGDTERALAKAIAAFGVDLADRDSPAKTAEPRR
jgi:HEPN domain-containing protein